MFFFFFQYSAKFEKFDGLYRNTHFFFFFTSCDLYEKIDHPNVWGSVVFAFFGEFGAPRTKQYGNRRWIYFYDNYILAGWVFLQTTFVTTIITRIIYTCRHNRDDNHSYYYILFVSIILVMIIIIVGRWISPFAVFVRSATSSSRWRGRLETIAKSADRMTTVAEPGEILDAFFKKFKKKNNLKTKPEITRQHLFPLWFLGFFFGFLPAI